ncbi:MAG: hypothetical protein RIS79_1428, partial [Verrucomicrobiota bacterium]
MHYLLGNFSSVTTFPSSNACKSSA